MISKIVTLGDVCNKGSSNIAQKDLVDRDGIYPIYGAAGYIKNVDFAHQDKPYLAVVKDGAGIGRVMKLPANSSIIGTMQYILPKGNIDIDYLYFALQYMNLSKYFSGSTIPHIYFRDYQKEKLPLPELSEQQGKAYVLLRIEQLIECYRQQLTKLDELVKSQFVEMFGTFPANEHSWPVGTIRDGVMDVRYGSSRKAAEGNNGQYPYLRMNNITYSGELDLSDVKTIDIPDDELDKCSVRRGDVLFNRTNSRELVGKTCVYNRDELMVLAGFVVRVRVNDRLLPEFLSAFMNTDFTKTLLLSMCKAAIGQANINATEFQNIGIYFPPIDHQQEFVQMKAQADKSKLAVKQSLEKLEMLKKSLMQQYFG